MLLKDVSYDIKHEHVFRFWFEMIMVSTRMSYYLDWMCDTFLFFFTKFRIWLFKDLFVYSQEWNNQKLFLRISE